ncbi:MAG: cobyrinic acid a,c-diamide synthase [Herbinix sp.]|jgi:cobyrinic acid a,c-diamide synthase|nr:cobyrinic acid a,c-diamide synthase [Herbinix sp.]
MKLPRIMFAATASGSGKTMITCGILKALVNRGQRVASFKCGPDYIDPMFHSRIIGAKSINLDTFFTDENTTRYLFGKTAKEVDISIFEGVMGFYDGLSARSTKASSYELAKITDTPVILIINCKGMSLSILPILQGFLEYKKDSQIVGVVLNQIAKSIYPEIKEQIELELSVKVLGYVPYVKEVVIESRHLGLVTPYEIEDYHNKLNKLAQILEETIDFASLLQLADNTSELTYEEINIPKVMGEPYIAVAKDEAFCFYYEDNLELLKRMGARLIEFSPLRDEKLPDHIQGLLLGGGYPELYAEHLSKNESMRNSILVALQNGMPCMAECGGFMYLHRSMEDMEGHPYPMVGFIDGETYRTEHLNRFGYVTLSANKNQMIAEKDESIKAHEFHYYESSSCGEAFTALKSSKNKQWNCIHGDGQLAMGFPHLFYYSNLNIPYRFLKRCIES